MLFAFDAIPIILTLKRFANLNRLVNSVVFPEFEMIISTSFFSIWPASPCETPTGSTKKLGIPTLEKVAEAFLQINEFLKMLSSKKNDLITVKEYLETVKLIKRIYV